MKEGTKENMNQKMIRAVKLFASFLFVVVMVLVFLLVGVRIFGLQIYTVLSGSMEPAYQTGSLIYVKEVDTEELKENDVITFRLGGSTIATHRIVEVVMEENDSGIRFRTKGDANDNVDSNLVSGEDVIGTPIFTIPYLGYLAVFIQQPPGSYVAISGSIAVILFVTLADMLSEGDKDTKRKRKKGEEE